MAGYAAHIYGGWVKLPSKLVTSESAALEKPKNRIAKETIEGECLEEENCYTRCDPAQHKRLSRHIRPMDS